jgi:hypothetical protein
MVHSNPTKWDIYFNPVSFINDDRNLEAKSKGKSKRLKEEALGLKIVDKTMTDSRV